MAVLASVTVHRDLVEVFRHLEDPALAAEWQLGVLEHHVVHQADNVVGTRYHQVVGDHQHRIVLRGEVTGYVPGQEIELLVTGRGIRSRVRYQVGPDPAGTRVDVIADVRVGGPLFPLLAPFTRRRTVKQLRAELARLAAICET